MNIVGSYDEVAENYGNIVDSKPFHTHYERPNFIKFLPQDLDNCNVLDLGCGTGWYAQEVIKRNGQITAIDCSIKMVNKTKNRISGQGRVVQHDLNLPLNFVENNSLDYILAPLVIHYIKDWDKLFQDLSNKLKPSGKLIFSTHQPHCEIQIFDLENYFETKLLQDTWEDIGRVEFYHHSLHDLFAAIKKSNLRIDIIEEPQPLKELSNIEPELYKNLSSKPCLLFGVIYKF